MGQGTSTNSGEAYEKVAADMEARIKLCRDELQGDLDALAAPNKPILTWETGSLTNVRGTVSDVKNIVNRYFGKGGDQASTVHRGFQSTIYASVQTILDETDPGEFKQKNTFMYVENNSVIRIDVNLWRKNFGEDEVPTDALVYVIASSFLTDERDRVEELTQWYKEKAGSRCVGAMLAGANAHMCGAFFGGVAVGVDIHVQAGFVGGFHAGGRWACRPVPWC
ncbi:unnamed protein product [Rhizoctonia solani]|uniref:Uncharacterized protein n=1 Tax=Rhizoctonia solani TaxID=456999 RepID=A0A8H3BTE0_9AGAM|nr:unnamed protein product [Rhizoctonia solani]